MGYVMWTAGPPIILVAEMLNASTAFIVWQAHHTQPITGYEVYTQKWISYLLHRQNEVNETFFLSPNFNYRAMCPSRDSFRQHPFCSSLMDSSVMTTYPFILILGYFRRLTVIVLALGFGLHHFLWIFCVFI